jgi:antitoxin CptB
MQNDPHDEIRLKKLKFRAWRRGFREADLILGPFADSYASAMSAEELSAFETLLDQPDHDLYGWILDREPTPTEFDNDIMRRIKAFRDQAYALRKDVHGG